MGFLSLVGRKKRLDKSIFLCFTRRTLRGNSVIFINLYEDFIMKRPLRILVTTDADARSLKTKAGETISFREHQALLFGRFDSVQSVPITLKVPEGEADYEKGSVYELCGDSIELGSFGRMQMGYNVSLIKCPPDDAAARWVLQAAKAVEDVNLKLAPAKGA